MKIESKQDLINWMVENCEAWPDYTFKYEDNNIAIELCSSDTAVAFRDMYAYHCTKNEWEIARCSQKEKDIQSFTSQQEWTDYLVETLGRWPKNLDDFMYSFPLGKSTNWTVSLCPSGDLIAHCEDDNEFHCNQQEWEIAKAIRHNESLTARQIQAIIPQDHELIVRADGLHLITDDCKEYFFQDEKELIEALELIKKLKQWEAC